MIQFPEGQGEVGRSVYQRMMECRKLHDYSWSDKMLYGEDGKILTQRERGRMMNQKQRAFTIADMAAVLGGLGKGNKIVVSNALPAATEGESEAATATGEQADVIEENEEFVKMEDGTTLVKATVWWDNPLDKNYAKSWSQNVTHEVFANAVLVPTDAEAAAAEAEAEQSEKAEPATATA
jgi:hypothetical protein